MILVLYSQRGYICIYIYMGRMEKNMETTSLGFKGLVFRGMAVRNPPV